MCDSPAYELYSTYLFIKDNKPRFVDPGDEVGELLLERERRYGYFNSSQCLLVNLVRPIRGFGKSLNLLTSEALPPRNR